MPSSGSCPADNSLLEKELSFTKAMGHLWSIDAPSSEKDEVEGSLQRAMNFGNQNSARTDEIEDLCQKIVCGVSAKLRDSLEAKLHAALALYLPRIQKVTEHEAKHGSAAVDQTLAMPTQAHTVDKQPAKQETANVLNRHIQPNSSDKQKQQADTLHAAPRGTLLSKTSFTMNANLLAEEHQYANLKIVQEGSEKRKCMQSYEGDTDNSLFELAYHRKVNERSGPQAILHLIGCENLSGVDECPKGGMATFANSATFHGISSFVVMANTIFVAYEFQVGVDMVLDDSIRYYKPEWMKYIDWGFIVFFTLEVVFQIIAFRAWFFTAPGLWTWRVFDLFLVVISLSTAADVMFLRSFKFLRFLRQLRSLKSLRLLRVIGGIGALNQLRRLLNAVEACILPLFWSIVFIGMTMYFFSIFIFAGIVGNSERIQSDALLMEEIQRLFGGVPNCFRTLLNLIAGPDWGEYYDCLNQVGKFEAAIIPLFLLFVQIGVMNIVIGVFAEAAASGCNQPDLVAQAEMDEVEGFVGDMMSLYKSFMPDGQRVLNYQEFRTYVHREDVQAYLSAHGVDANHAQVIFRACDMDNSGAVDMHMFVLGLLRLRGVGKSIDLRIMIQSLSALESDMSILHQQYAQLSDQLQQEHSANVQF